MRTTACFMVMAVILSVSGAVWADTNEGFLIPRETNEPAVTWNHASSDTMGLGVKGRLWLADFDGNLQIDKNAIAGTDINLTSDLDIDSSDEIPEAEVYFHLSDTNRINFHFWTVQLKGSEPITRSITYAGSTYDVGTTVDSSIDITTYTLTYERLLPLPDLTGVSLGLQIGVKFIEFSGKLSATDAPIPFEEKEDFNAPIPVLGLRFQVDMAPVTLGAQLDGLKLSNVRNVDATIYDAVIEADITPWEGLYGGIGYHIFHVDVQDTSNSDEDIDVDMTLKGVFFAVGYRF